MMGHGERTGKDGACLTVLSLTVGKEKRIRRRLVVAELAGLAYEAS